ncbi:MAG: osmotically inducible protein C [Cyclobacteriaceae bacterium]|nr:MAG: osmotically inducible protein C [Cyclobacteriaceae bacterium]
MKQERLKIVNKEGHELSAYLRLPVDGITRTLAIFAHCFTCNKNLSAIRNISHALTQQKIGVLSFDFTGLGESEGDFSDTNFSSNISDLIAAADYLEQHYQPAQIIIGHSLGGAAVIQAAAKIPGIKAVATIGAPADVPHVTHLFKQGLQEIKETGQAEVNIGGRPFTIKRQFIDDLEQNPAGEILKNLRKALLIMHSPQDRIVGIENAAKIYKQAFHPKSFITLDGSDHLLSEKKDSLYAGKMIASWASRYIDAPESTELLLESQVLTRTGSNSLLTDILTGKHHLLADEPESVGGTNMGPTPYDYLLAALGACTGMTLRMYADRKKWTLEEIKVNLKHEKRHADDCEDCENPKSRLDHIDKEIELTGDLDQQQRERLLEISGRCPVHRTLESEIIINSQLK